MVQRIHGGTSGQALESVRQDDDVYSERHPQSHRETCRESKLGTGLYRGGMPATRTVPIGLTAPGTDQPRVKKSAKVGSKSRKR